MWNETTQASHPVETRHLSSLSLFEGSGGRSVGSQIIYPEIDHWLSAYRKGRTALLLMVDW